MKLDSKVVIVTGASSGMGRAIALLFAEEGANVIALARRKERLDELAKTAADKGQTIVPFVADISKDSDLSGAVTLALEKFNKIDILVNNAGIMDNMVPLDELTDELWAKVIDINLTAPMKLSRLVLKEMLKADGGIIVNVASVGGLNGSRAGAAYTASKHGIVGLTKNIGYQYAKKGIRCNVICPGAVDTEISAAGVNAPSPFGLECALSGMATNPRSGSAEEIATIALFLASDDSSFVNASTITADAGWSAY